MIKIENYIKPFQDPALIIRTSQTWTCPKSGYWRISAVGGGGSGAMSEGISYGSVGGGGGGGFCEKTAFILKGTEIVIVIGSGGASRNTSGTGYSGGNTTVVGGNFNLVAEGGSGGNRNNTATGAVLTGSDAGYASGGDIHYYGGRSGNCGYRNNVARATGGGSAGSPLGNGGTGGNATDLGSGGASGGGIGGNAVTYAPGGSGGSGSNNNGAPNIFGQTSSSGYFTTTGHCAGFETLYSPFYYLGGGCDSTMFTSDVYSGAGAGGVYRAGGSFSLPGILGGSAGVLSSDNIVLFDGGVGGGGGGLYCTGSSAVTGTGGNGIVTIEYLGLRL